MNVDVELTQDNSGAILNELSDKVAVALEMCGAQAENYAKMICPVDTGLLRNSITHVQADENTEHIGTNVEYAPYVEMGTSRQRAQPYLKPAVMDHVNEYKRMIQSVLQSQ